MQEEKQRLSNAPYSEKEEGAAKLEAERLLGQFIQVRMI